MITSLCESYDVSKYGNRCQCEEEDYMLRLQISLLLFISNGRAKTKLGILAFLCCGEFVKTSIVADKGFPRRRRQPQLTNLGHFSPKKHEIEKNLIRGSAGQGCTA